MEHRFTTPEPVRLHVELGRGSLRVEATEEARHRGETLVAVAGELADQTVVTQDGDLVSVVVPRRRFGFGSSDGPEVHVRVTVPSGSDAALRSGSAAIEVAGSLGALATKSGSGVVTVQRLHGRGLLESGSGDLHVKAVDGELQARSGSGDVHLGVVTAPTSVSTGSGDVAVERVEAPLVVKTGSGDLAVVEATAAVSLASGSGDAHVRTFRRGDLAVRNASGDVRLGIPSGTPVWTDVETRTGSIRNDLAPTGEPAEGQDHVELRVRTASGDIQLDPL